MRNQNELKDSVTDDVLLGQKDKASQDKTGQKKNQLTIATIFEDDGEDPGCWVEINVLVQVAPCPVEVSPIKFNVTKRM